MFRGIDHLVIACPDPDAAAARLEAELGLLATGGGTHEGRGSHNRLVFLADGSYLELIGVSDATLASGSSVGAATVRSLEHGGGLATFALAVDDIEDWTDALGPAAHGSRRRDDGDLVEWWTIVPDEPLSPTVPFLIEHLYAGAEWGPQALADRATFVHPVGSPVSMAALEIAGLPGAAQALAGLGIRVDGDTAEIGSHRIRLVDPESGPASAVELRATTGEPRTTELGDLRLSVTSGTG
jgi:hypothetical protein